MRLTPIKPQREIKGALQFNTKQPPPCHAGVILVKGIRAKILCHLPDPCSSKKLREKRGQPCGQKLIFLLVAHCCRRANMPQENSTTHTPLFSSGFSQLYTQQQSHNWERTRISVSAQKACARPVQPEVNSMIWEPWSRPLFVVVFFFLFIATEKRRICHFQMRAHLFTFQFRFEPLPRLLLFPFHQLFRSSPFTSQPLHAHLLHSAPVSVLSHSLSLSLTQCSQD